jgi:hypothetical protein
MRTTKTWAILVLALGLMVCPVKVSEAVPMGPAFTYQGRLIDANSAADGLYDFQFKLHDDPCDDSQVGSDVNKPDVEVSDGYFTVDLDFGSEVFDGNAVWLQIGVRPGEVNDPNGYTMLSLRQRVMPTPYALGVRGVYVDGRENVGLGTTSPTGKLHVDGGQAGLGADGGDIMIEGQKGGDGGGLSGDDGGDGGNIILLPGEGGEPRGFGVPGRDGSVGIGTDRPAAKLDVRGDISVDDKIKAYDSGGLTLATDDGVARLAVADSGNVGIGTTNPIWELEVANPTPGNATESAVTADDAGGAIAAYSSTFSGFPHLADRVSLFSNSLTATGLDLRADGVTSDIRFYTGGITPSDERIRITPSGNVGIGTSPSEKLDVAGNIDVSNNRVKNYKGFPRPDYDSGWVAVAQDEVVTLYHNISGNVDNYVVDMQFKSDYGLGIHNRNFGVDVYHVGTTVKEGVEWIKLTTDSITIRREEDDVWADKIRIRIWVYD